MNFNFEIPITVGSIEEFVCALYKSDIKWNNVFEYAKNYNYLYFSQKPSDGLEKYEAFINGSKVIFSALPVNDSFVYNLEIMYNDNQEYIYEIPHLQEKSVTEYLELLLKKIHKQNLKICEEMNIKLFNLWQ